MYFTHTDAIVGNIAISRTYNSARQFPTNRFGLFGPGWNSSLDQRLKVVSENPKAVELRTADGTPLYYIKQTGVGTTWNVYTLELPYGQDSWIEETVAGGWRRTLRRGGGSEEYDAAGRLLSIIELSGQHTDYGYDSSNRLATITRDGRSITLVYDSVYTTRVKRIKLGSTETVLVEYTYRGGLPGRLEDVDYPGTTGTGYRYHYDAGVPTRLLSVTDSAQPPNPIEAHLYEMNSPYRAYTSEIGDGIDRLTLTFPQPAPPDDAPLGETKVTDALGNETFYRWRLVKHVRRITEIEGPCGSCGGVGPVRRWTYDSKGRIDSYFDGAGLTSYIYDQTTGDLLEERMPLGHKVVYTYWPDGRVKTVTAPNLAVTEYTYVDAGPDLIKQQVAPPQAPVRQTDLDYTTDGRLEWVTDALGNRTQFSYDSVFRDLISVTGPLGTITPTDLNDHVTRFEYDAMGRRNAVVDPLGKRTETVMDGRGRVTRVRRFDGTRPIDTTYTYPSRLQTITTDPELHATDQIRDKYGRLWKILGPVVNGVRAETRYGYDSMSNLTSITDAENRTTAFDLDGFNRVETITYPGGETEAFTYDTAGRLWSRSRGGIVTTYEYDALSRLTSRTHSDVNQQGWSSYGFTYDGNGDIGFLTAATHDSRTLAWDYDLAGQMLSETATSPGMPPSTVSYQYDLLGRRQWLKLGTETWLTYDYDAASRLDKIWRGTSVFDFTYNDAGQRVSLAYPNGVVTAYSYDDLWRPLGIVASLPDTQGGTVASSAYTYNDRSDRRTKTHLFSVDAYLYDPEARLREVSRNADPPVTYSYDKVGNRHPTVWNYNLRNELVSMPGYTFTYARGNQTSKSSGLHAFTYEWTPENQLKRVTYDQVEVARYQYDAIGRRIERNVAGAAYTYVYDGEDLLKVEAPGLTNPSPHMYVHGPGIDEPLAVVQTTGTQWYYHADGLGSVIAATDTLGSPVFTRQYDEWGNPQGPSTNQEGYAFTGREWDPETELYYYRARYYDPKIGRFISEDPIRWAGGINFYAYVENNPVMFTDPLGLDGGSGMQALKFPPGQFRRPDFYELACQMGIGAFSLTIIPGTASVPGGGLGPPSGCSCSATANWLNQASTPSGQQTLTFTTGPAASAGGFSVVGGQVTVLPNGQSATGVGFGFGGFGGAAGFGFDPNAPCDSDCAKRLKGAIGAMSKK